MPRFNPNGRTGSPVLSPGDVLLAATGFGLLAGGVEAVVAVLREHVMHRTRFMGRDFFWELPLADAVTLLSVALLFLLLTLLFPRLRTSRVVLAVFGASSLFSVLLLWQQIHPIAGALLAVGLGTAAAGPLAGVNLRRLRWSVPGAVLLLVALGAGANIVRGAMERRALSKLPTARSGAPNVLLLVLDTVRAWSMGLYGYRRPTTPNLRAWAERGTLFERTLSGAPWTTLSHAVMFTGRYPTELSVDWDRPLDATFPTLAEVLRASGYATAGFVANYTQAGQPTGLARGFSHYEDYPITPLSVLRRTALWRRAFAVDWIAKLIGRRRVVDGLPGATVNARFLDWVQRSQDHPWFAFINYFEAHGPYLPPPEFEKMFMGKPDSVIGRYWRQIERLYGPSPVPVPVLAEELDAYDGAIRYLDAQVEALLLALSDRGLLPNTIVVVTSDHGELFGEHGVIAHGNSLYLPVLHVPLLLIAPGRVPAGKVVPSLASLRDLPATLLDLVGLPNPGLPGNSLTRRWSFGAEPDTLRAALSYNRLLPKWPPSPILRGSMRTVVLDSLQYILNGDGVEELYHLGQDSWELHNLAARPEYQAELARYRLALQVSPKH